MEIINVIVILVICAIASAFFYGLWLLENDSDDFRKNHGVKPKYYRCVTKGDKHCNHAEWCDAEIALYPEQYAEEMKRLENDTTKDQ